jgi:hypothetical protein
MNALRTTLLVALATVVLVGTCAAGAVAATPGPGEAPCDAGPQSDLPDRVPDFVGGVLDGVNEFLSGGVDDLGETVSDMAGSGAGEGDADDGTDIEGGA